MNAVVDTNVLLVANGKHPGVSPECVLACANALATLKANGKIFLDDRFRILNEYKNKTSPKKGTGPGDAFLKWLYQNLANPKHCVQISLVEHDLRGFASFPDDPSLVNFDPPDRKFVAVAAATPEHPPILQAADSKWVGWAPDLAKHDIEIDFLCTKDIRRFHLNKTPTN